MGRDNCSLGSRRPAKWGDCPAPPPDHGLDVRSIADEHWSDFWSFDHGGQRLERMARGTRPGRRTRDGSKLAINSDTIRSSSAILLPCSLIVFCWLWESRRIESYPSLRVVKSFSARISLFWWFLLIAGVVNSMPPSKLGEELVCEAPFSLNRSFSFTTKSQSCTVAVCWMPLVRLVSDYCLSSGGHMSYLTTYGKRASPDFHSLHTSRPRHGEMCSMSDLLSKSISRSRCITLSWQDWIGSSLWMIMEFCELYECLSYLRTPSKLAPDYLPVRL